MVAIAVAIGAGAGLAYESSQPTVFSTNGRLLIGPSLEGDNQIDSTGQLSRSTLQQTLAEITTGSEVTQTARAEVDNRSSTYSVSAVVIPETNVVKVTVDGRAPERTIELATAIMAQAERVFEARYPVFDVAVVDEPLDAPKIAPDPEFGLVMGGLLGAVGATIIVVALAGATADVPNRRRRREVMDDPTGGFRARDRRRRREPAQGVDPPPVETERVAEHEPVAARSGGAEPYDTEPYDTEPNDTEPFDEAETPSDDVTHLPPEPEPPTATRPEVDNPRPDAVTERPVDASGPTDDDPDDETDQVVSAPIPFPPPRPHEKTSNVPPGRHLIDDDSVSEASVAAQVDTAIESRLPDWITRDWSNLSASEGPGSADSDS